MPANFLKSLASGPVKPDIDKDVIERLAIADRIIKDVIEDEKVVGISIGILHEGEEVTSLRNGGHYGYVENLNKDREFRELKTNVHGWTRYPLGQISELFAVLYISNRIGADGVEEKKPPVVSETAIEPKGLLSLVRSVKRIRSKKQPRGADTPIQPKNPTQESDTPKQPPINKLPLGLDTPILHMLPGFKAPTEYL
ncbi:hypothetical protein BJ508DRAFT_325115 [Ascobolus immersus RN42]|uniref:Uncharacterized protein n=1 Tax=Ascobolus immersus RN42 TaxID=1160509 RepID=A0A3N4IBZ2_ASCIM|nr:hypothetical protein BJ508DRAFT_325115 [Ascobolus immersus RN42]